MDAKLRPFPPKKKRTSQIYMEELDFPFSNRKKLIMLNMLSFFKEIGRLNMVRKSGQTPKTRV